MFFGAEAHFAQQLVSQIPWGHNLITIAILICKSKNDAVVEYELKDIVYPYTEKCLRQCWDEAVSKLLAGFLEEI